MSSNPYAITQQLEHDLCEYTGARYAVAVNSCSAALLLCLEWFAQTSWRSWVELPRRTYVSVPCAVRRAGFRIKWVDSDWRGEYQLAPLPVWDSARRFTYGMYRESHFQCVSFSSSKILGIEQGGAILHADAKADAWFRRMRFDGRAEGVDPHKDTFELLGHHCIMLPSIAAQLVLKLHHLPKTNEDLPRHEYPDLSKHKAFQ